MHGHGNNAPQHGHGGHAQHGQQTDGADAPFLTADKVILLLGLITYGIGQSILFVVFPPLVEEIGLKTIDAEYLTRDRVVADPEEMAVLKESIRSRGQQTPIEVVALDKGRYGLISGWRRLTAMRELSEEDGGYGFGLIDALVPSLSG